MLHWKNVSVKIRTTSILKNICFNIENGQSAGLFGDNGSGKTIMAKAIAGIIPVCGEASSDFDPSKSIFISFQSDIKLANGAKAYRQQRWNCPDPEFVPTVRDELSSIKNINLRNALIDKFNFSDLTDRFTLSLSNGEQRKLELIKALANKPQILVIDNAYNGLDIQSREVLHSMFNQMIKNKQTLVLTGIKPSDFPSGIQHFYTLENNTVKPVLRQNITENTLHNNKNNSIEIPLWEDTNNSESIVSIKNMDLVYGKEKILNNINWEVKKSEKWVLSGGNGSGKTSLLNMIFADNPRVYGNIISLFGQQRGNGESIWDIKKQIGFISPEMHQYLPLRQKVSHVVCSGYYDTEGIYKAPTSYQHLMAVKWLKTVKLEHLSEKPYDTLPTSAQRMVLLIRALIKNPPLLILDEPFQGLDNRNIKILKTLLNSIARQTNCTMIFVSHYSDEIPESFNLELHLNKGNVEYIGKRKNNA
jgi:molybdate transport system ATP-binding protein